MPIALVGAAGAIAVVTSGTSVAPTFAQATTAGNLLVAVISYGASTAITTTATGWVQATASTSSPQAAIWYRPNCAASEAAPSFSSSTTSAWRAELSEWSGATPSPLDKVGNSGATVATTSPVTAAATAADSAATNLAIVCTSESNTTAANTGTFGNSAGWIALADNGSTSLINHIQAAYQVFTAGGVSADSDTVSYSGALNKFTWAIATFSAVMPTPAATVAPSQAALNASSW